MRAAAAATATAGSTCARYEKLIQGGGGEEISHRCRGASAPTMPAMAREARKYRRTEAGRRAWESPGSGLPAAYRRILGMVRGVAYSDEVLRGMHDCAARQVQDWLDEPETRCLHE